MFNPPNRLGLRLVIASNEPFSSWTKTFTDPRLSAVISALILK